MNLVGKGFRLEEADVRALGYDPAALPDVIKPYLKGRAFLQGGDRGFVIDLFGFTEERARREHPALYQWLLDRVKPERDLNNRASYREKWWMFGEPRGKLRGAWFGLKRMLVTVETAKHRIFAFQSMPLCPDHKLYAICTSDALVLGVLSSVVHTTWAPRAGGRLGVGNDPTWTNTTTFFPFPFLADDTGLTPALSDRIRQLAETIDAHRKSRQALHGDVTLTGLYNVLEKRRSGASLSTAERAIDSHGLVGVLGSLHADLDAAVLAAYGWSDLGPTLAAYTQPETRAAAVEDLLMRLVTLNSKRAAEEAAGTIRWLRPEVQRGGIATQTAIEGTAELEAEEAVQASPAAPIVRAAWPAGLPEQIKAVAGVLSSVGRPMAVVDIEARFAARGRWRDRLPTILDTLEAVGRARKTADERWQAV